MPFEEPTRLSTGVARAPTASKAMSLRLFCILTLQANGMSLESEFVSDLAVFE